MLLNSNQECICGRSFDNAGAFTRHKKNCQKGRKHLASALQRAKETHVRKKRRIDSQGTFSGELSHESLDSHGAVDGTHVVSDFTSYIVDLLIMLPRLVVAGASEPSGSQPNQASKAASDSIAHNSGHNEAEVRIPLRFLNNAAI